MSTLEVWDSDSTQPNNKLSSVPQLSAKDCLLYGTVPVLVLIQAMEFSTPNTLRIEAYRNNDRI